MTSALILAADPLPQESKRKICDDIGGASALKRIVMVYKQAGVKKIVMVTGDDADEVEKHCSHLGIVFLRRETTGKNDMLVSVKIGLGYLRDRSAKVFVSPAYVPFLTAETVKKMSSVAGQAVIPMFEKKAGYPILVTDAVFDIILQYEGDAGVGGLEHVLSVEGADRLYIQVKDKGILADIRHMSNIKSLTASQGLRDIRPESKISLLSEIPFFGPGTSLLLSLTRDTNSLKQAAQQMGISYSKANKMIDEAEEHLGFKLLATRQGGNGGGSSTVTRKALDLMKRFNAFESECADFAKQSFEKHFGDFRESGELCFPCGMDS